MATSSAPAWETLKENAAPTKGGRDAGRLAVALAAAPRPSAAPPASDGGVAPSDPRAAARASFDARVAAAPDSLAALAVWKQ